MNLEQRAQAFLMLSKFTGVNVTSDFLRNTYKHYPQAGIPRIHNLAEGIFKPAHDKYAFCLWSRSAAGKDREIYSDYLRPNKDGTWTMMYAAKRGDLQSASNKSLFACMADKVPVLIVVTARPSGSLGGARYKIIGPAMIESFDPISSRFFLRGCSEHIIDQIGKYKNTYEQELYALRNRLILPFQVCELRRSQQVYREIREKAFREIILDEYRCQCVVCQSKFLLKQEGDEDLVEAEAAHIIPVSRNGPDDPRNGLSFCRRHHWAYDQGLFTVTDSKAIKISPSVLRAERRRFDLEEYEGEPLVGPVSESCRPAEEALHWHQKIKFISI
jgi:hypothetical protein